MWRFEKAGHNLRSEVVQDIQDDVDRWRHHHHHHHVDRCRHHLLGYPAYSQNDKIPPWWGNVSNDEGGNVSGQKPTKHNDELFFWSIYMWLTVNLL